MIRDFDLFRDLLLLIEEKVTYDEAWDTWPELFEKGYSDKQVFYHLQLLSDCSYIVLDRYDEIRADNFFVVRMTNDGHDYLDSVRNPEIWRKTKSGISKAGGTASLAVVQATAVAVFKMALSKTGIEIE